jgi:uncharacterized protein YecT (DUF1311 family)
MRAGVVLAGVVAFVVGNAHAAGVTKKPSDCMASATAQYDMDMCAGQDFRKADDALNALYRQMMPRYNAADQVMLRDAERKWLDYRDAECAFETNLSAGGTIHPMAETMCRTERTKARIKELQTQLHCTEDLGCNPPDK